MVPQPISCMINFVLKSNFIGTFPLYNPKSFRLSLSRRQKHLDTVTGPWTCIATSPPGVRTMMISYKDLESCSLSNT